MLSTVKAEYGVLFLNDQTAAPIQTTLIEIGQSQPPTLSQVDKFTVVGIANNIDKERMSKAMDIHFHWIQYRILQGHFHVFLKSGPTNLGDYHSKHHPVSHHIQMRSTNLYGPSSPYTILQGCVESLNC